MDLSAGDLASLDRDGPDRLILCASLYRCGPPLPFRERHLLRDLSLRGPSIDSAELARVEDHASQLEFRERLRGTYLLYCVGCGPFSSISRFQMAPSRV